MAGDSVVFFDVLRSYTAGENLHVAFEWKPDLVTNTLDWIGLFRVGWISSRDYYTFEWVGLESAERRQGSVTFSGRRLPPEDVHFYQVCYVSRDGTVCGASVPFQFIMPDCERQTEKPKEELINTKQKFSLEPALVSKVSFPSLPQ